MKPTYVVVTAILELSSVSADNMNAIVAGRMWHELLDNQAFISDKPEILIRATVSKHDALDDALKATLGHTDGPWFPLPYCPLCEDVKLILDTQTMMEDHGENWELLMVTLDPLLIPYKCDVCKQDGTLEDFYLIAKGVRREP